MPLSSRVKKHLAESKHIAKLDLSEAGLNADDMAELIRLIKQNDVKIDYLNLYRNNIDDAGAKHLSQLTDENVRYLNVCYCDISDKGAVELFRSKIKEIDISDNDLTDESIDVFLREGKQTHLTLSRNRRITPDKFTSAARKVESNRQPASSATLLFGFYSAPASSVVSEKDNAVAQQTDVVVVSKLNEEFSVFFQNFIKAHPCDSQALLTSFFSNPAEKIQQLSLISPRENGVKH